MIFCGSFCQIAIVAPTSIAVNATSCANEWASGRNR